MKPSGRFKRVIQAAEGNTVLIPILYGYLEGGKLPNPFTISVRGGTGTNAPDDWFHPSAHPRMGERQLYLYLTQPDRWEPEPFDYTIKMSAMVGSVIHDIVETALTDLGYLIEPKGECLACGRKQPQDCHEHGAVDIRTRSRGHMDGLLRTGGFEFKTCHPLALKDITSNDLEAFRAKWPYYYSQVQEYMRMTGLPQYTVLFWAMGNPWTMKEFTVPADHMLHIETERKYLAVRRAVAEGQMPEPCCAPRSVESRSCPAMGCPIKRL